MPLSVTPPDRLLNRTRTGPDDERRRVCRAVEGSDGQSFEFPCCPLFDSAAPVLVDADTEAAMAELEHVHAVPLAAVIRQYRDEDEEWIQALAETAGDRSA